MRKYLPCFLLLILASVNLQQANGLAVMSIDLGSEFMKIAIVKPGVPMEIVLNKESRRKTPLIVSLRGIEREFGENAYFQAIKKPKTAYLFITQLLGKSIENPSVIAYREKYPFYDIRENVETKSIYFQHDETTTYTPEEILAMILEYARELASDFSEQPVDAAVITVPAFFNQAERKAVLKAAEIANLKVLQLINSNVAAGLNYGVFRRKDFDSTGTTLMFFDMGSMGTTATVVTYQTYKLEGDTEANPRLTVRGVGFDRTLGGNAFTQRLAKHLGKLFQEKTKKDPFKNPKAILKLYKEAERIKNILSANADHMAQIESLIDDVDFKAKVTRDEFEAMCADLFERVQQPIKEALKTAELSADELSTVILVGGGTRIPRVQDELMMATNKKELSKNLNTDEAPAMGAVYQAAFQSKGYKVKKFLIKDINLYPLVIDFEKSTIETDSSAAAAVQSSSRIVRYVIFDRGNTYPKVKWIRFNNKTDDFKFNVNYGDLSSFSPSVVKELGSLNVTEVHVKGVKAILDKHKEHETSGIRAHFRLDDSGVFRMDRVDAAFEISGGEEESTLSKIGNKISSFFGGTKDQDNKEDDDSKQEQQNKADSTTASKEATSTADPATNSTTNNSTGSAEPPKPKTVKESYEFETHDLDQVDIGRETLASSKSKLKNIREKEKEKKARAAGINALEAFIFDARDKLNQDEFIKCSTDAERTKLKDKVDEVDTWLSEVEESVPVKTFGEKLAELRNSGKDIFYRINEKKLRPKKIDEIKDALNISSNFLEQTRNSTGPEKALTEVEHATLEKLIASTKEWLNKMIDEQAKVADNQQPKLTASDITEKIDALKREVAYMVNKLKYFRPKTTTTSTPKSSDSKKKTTPAEKEEQPEEQQEQQQSDDPFENTKPSADDADQQQQEQQQETNGNNDDDSMTTTDNPEL